MFVLHIQCRWDCIHSHRMSCFSTNQYVFTFLGTYLLCMPDSAACIASELGKIFYRLYCVQEMQQRVLPGSVAIAVTVQCLFKVCWLLTTFLSAEPPKCPSEQDKHGLRGWIKWYSALNASRRTPCIYRLACSVTMTIWVKYLCIVYEFCLVLGILCISIKL